MRKFTINDTDREDWVRNDSGLYNWWRSEMRGEKKLREFVRSHRSEIDEVIRKANDEVTRKANEYPPGYMQGRGAA
jgi:hypothetical protein